MKNFIKITLTAFVLSLTLFACSSDDDDQDKVDNLIEIKSFSAEVENNDYVFSWVGVNDAYSYVVYYRAEGKAEWSRSNFYLPYGDNKPGQLMKRSFFAGFGKGIKYEMYIVAYRDSQGVEFAKSKTIISPEIPIVEDGE